jgi:hypothetical protein
VTNTIVVSAEAPAVVPQWIVLAGASVLVLAFVAVLLWFRGRNQIRALPNTDTFSANHKNLVFLALLEFRRSPMRSNLALRHALFRGPLLKQHLHSRMKGSPRPRRVAIYLPKKNWSGSAPGLNHDVTTEN